MANVAARLASQSPHLLKALWETILWLWGVWSRGAGGQGRITNAQRPMPNASIRVAYSVVHQIPGRVRFRVPRLSQDGKYAHRLQMLAESDPSITGVRINRDAASVAFNYDPKVMAEVERRLPKVPITLASPREMKISHLVRLIQTAGEIVGQDYLTQQKNGGTVKWRDGELLPATPLQSFSQPVAQLIILACSLDVRKAEISSSCCLLKSKAGKPLAGGAKSARIVKLRKLNVLI